MPSSLPWPETSLNGAWQKRGIPDDELLAVIAAAVRAYAKQDPHPLIRNTVDTPEHRVHFNVINPIYAVSK